MGTTRIYPSRPMQEVCDSFNKTYDSGIYLSALKFNFDCKRQESYHFVVCLHSLVVALAEWVVICLGKFSHTINCLSSTGKLLSDC